MLLTVLVAPLLTLASSAAAQVCMPSKRGLAWPTQLNQGVPFDAFPNDTITSYYTWTREPVRNAPFPFVPMLWGCDADSAKAFSAAVDADFAIDSYKPTLTRDKAILAFSEPALADQSNCTPADAARVWLEVLEPLKQKGYRLGTPAVTINDKGHAWLLEWFVQCNSCHPDFLALHWYDMTFDDLQEKLQGYHDAFKMPIWLTEFAVQNFTNDDHTPDPNARQASLLEITSVLNQSMDYLDSQDWVERYFWFGAMSNMQGLNPLDSLFNPLDQQHNGSLNALGQMYVATSEASQCFNNGVGAIGVPMWQAAAASLLGAGLLYGII